MCRWGRNEIPGGSLQATSCRGAGRLKAAVILSMVEILLTAGFISQMPGGGDRLASFHGVSFRSGMSAG
jgi:hypothetical protein